MIAPLHSPGLRLPAGEPPYSEHYQDHYFSRAGGLAESRHVFLDGSQLPRRWRNRERFVIGETGFGTGLNFLATWLAWVGDGQRCRRLHYVAVELHPLTAEELRQALSPWSELAPLAQQLIGAWPPPVPGWRRLALAGDRVLLDLLFGEAGTELARLDARVDAWYLDGFAPARNPAIWRPAVLSQVARLTAAGGTVASYTAAGAVRRGLQQAGFELVKRAGFADKREMLSGILARAPAASPQRRPWLQPPPPIAADRAVIIGAGLAGSATANALARRGWRVCLLDQNAAPAMAASGNPAAVVMPRAEAQRGAVGQLLLQAYLYALGRLTQQGAAAAAWQPTGVLALALKDQSRRRYQRFIEAYGLPPGVARWLDAADSTALAGVPIHREALYYPGGGWLAPAGWCRVLVATGDIETCYGAVAARIERIADGWQVRDPAGRRLAAAPVLILANANGAGGFAPTTWLPLVAARGQLSAVPATSASARLRSVVYGKGYLIPAHGGRHIVGATLTARDSNDDLRSADDARILRQLRRSLPRLAAELAPRLQGTFAAVRATSPDRLPLVGGVPELAAFRSDYKALALGARWRNLGPPRPLPGLYLLTGLGTRGVTLAPLAAELLAALVSGEPTPLPRDLVEALSPARFLFRALQRGRL